MLHKIRLLKEFLTAHEADIFQFVTLSVFLAISRFSLVSRLQ